MQAPTTAGGDQVIRQGAGWRWAVSAAGVLIVAIVIIAALAFARVQLGHLGQPGIGDPDPDPEPGGHGDPAADYRPVPGVVPSVVLITTSKGSLGSGLIVTDTGIVLTANHVVSGGGGISILFADGTKAAATVPPQTRRSTLPR